MAIFELRYEKYYLYIPKTNK